MADKEYISHLETQNALLIHQVKLLEEKVMQLLSLHQQRGVKKDSRNSSLPPSSDMPSSKPSTNKTQSTRSASELKSGGQPGHEGTTLSMSSTPDITVDLKSSYCQSCGASLSDLEFTFVNKRQVIELPPIKPIYKEYRQYSCSCGRCAHKQVADFPKDVIAPIQYGSSVESLVSYLSVRHYLPFARMAELLTDVFSLPLSQGTIGNILERSAKRCEGIYANIKDEIAGSPVTGSDETGANVNGKMWWIWVWQNLLNTYIVASENRGSKTIDEVWPNGLPTSTLVSDRWSAQLKMVAKNHQLCLAHLLRDVIYLEQSEQLSFATEFKGLILKIFDLKKNHNLEYLPDSQEAKSLEYQLSQLLAISIDKTHHPNSAKFQRSIIKHRNSVLPCIYDREIPPDNNGSERAVRTIKVKQKISGQFKSGQHAFCILRSVIDTLRKRSLNILAFLQQIIQVRPV